MPSSLLTESRIEVFGTAADASRRFGQLCHFQLVELKEFIALEISGPGAPRCGFEIRTASADPAPLPQEQPGRLSAARLSDPCPPSSRRHPSPSGRPGPVSAGTRRSPRRRRPFPPPRPIWMRPGRPARKALPNGTPLSRIRTFEKSRSGSTAGFFRSRTRSRGGPAARRNNP